MNHSSQAPSQFASIVAGRLQRENDRMRAAIMVVLPDLADYQEIIAGVFRNSAGGYDTDADRQHVEAIEARLKALKTAMEPA